MSGPVEIWESTSEGVEVNLEEIAVVFEYRPLESWKEKKMNRVVVNSLVIEVYISLSNWKWVRILRPTVPGGKIMVRYQTAKMDEADVARVHEIMEEVGFRKVRTIDSRG